ncbi:carbohydrate kinase [Kitasatospora kazusensis]|uniref:Carbohydrate kinase n=1 Tax=Kitasatospora kazusensis TaxID=407974 RepID=A0ABP5L3L8_9ACTN
MTAHRITVLGESVADAFVEPPHAAADGLTLRVQAGGGPANTAVALARLGTPTRFLGRFSDDVFGRLFRERLASAGVDLTHSVRAAEPSTLAVAELSPHGEAAYSFHAEAAADWQWDPAELAGVPLTDTDCVHTGSLALVREPGAAAVEEFLARAVDRATVSIDPNVRPLLVAPARYRDRLARWCALADVLRLSADDLAVLLPGTSPEQACDQWHRAGVRLVVVTLGADGALASLDGVRITVPALRVEVADTVGAGDAFTAGLLHHLGAAGLLGGRLDSLTTAAVEAACGYAARVAALTCAVPGADPPRAGELPPTRTAPAGTAN